jgi:hypothetical protein
MRRSSTALAVLVVCALVLLVAGCGGDVESRLPTTTVQTETDGEGGENENEPGETEREGDESEDEGGSEWGDPISQADSRGFTLPDKRRVGTSAASLGKASLQRAAGWAPPRITPTEHGDVRCSSRPGDPHQDPSHIVHVAAFEQAAIGVDLVDEEVAARRDPGDAKILAFEVRIVIVAVADGNAFPKPQDPVLAQTASAAEDLLGRLPRQLHLGVVAVAETETGLAVPSGTREVVRPSKLVLHERHQVPVGMVGRRDIPQDSNWPLVPGAAILPSSSGMT